LPAAISPEETGAGKPSLTSALGVRFFSIMTDKPRRANQEQKGAAKRRDERTRRNRGPTIARADRKVRTSRTAKAADPNSAIELEMIPNIGASLARDFRRIGIGNPRDLIGRDPHALYQTLCEKTRTRQDPCVLDTFISAVRFMEGAPALPWWHYTAERKQRYDTTLLGRRRQKARVPVKGRPGKRG
jgi:hypothetical protein